VLPTLAGVSSSSTLWPRYQRVRRRVEWLFWPLVLGLHLALNLAVALIDARDAGRPLPLATLALWEGSSHLAVLVLIPALVAWSRRYPLQAGSLRRNLPWHLLGSLLFSLAHVALMVALRHLAHGLAGGSYDFGPWLPRWGYEYLKDLRSYAAIVGVLTAYRFVLLRAQGEARVLDAPEPAPEPASADTPADAPAPAPEPPPARPERFLVRKLRSEFLIAASDIDCVQAQSNYVALHVRGHEYLLRSTLADFLTQLDPARFVRVHRSYAVNLERVVEIEPTDSGDARLRLTSGAWVPCSRRYREELQKL